MTGAMLGHYKILESLGAGGMGEVWAAEDTRLQRRVAIKILRRDVAEDEERLQRFEREAKSVAALDHPNIVIVHSFEEAPGPDGEPVHFITMQLVDGVPLSELIPARGLPLERLLDLGIPLADAVSAAHERGIVHRDLKPSNVMVSKDGRVRVLDFGLAKLWEGPEDAGPDSQTSLPTGAAFRTEEGVVMGTGAYMSPEQAEGKALDHRSDIFSLGILLYEMATGERPFQGGTKVSVISSIIKDTPASVSEINPALPRHLGRIIKLCLEKDPERRLQTAKDLRNQLFELRQEFLSGEHSSPAVSIGAPWWKRSAPEITQGTVPARSGPVSHTGSEPPRQPGRRLAAALAGLVLLAALVALWAVPGLRPGAGVDTAPLPLPDRKDVAILAITDDGADGGGSPALGAGLQAELSRRLARLSDELPLAVLPAERARAISSRDRAGIEQGANLVLDGSLEQTPTVARLSLALWETSAPEPVRGVTIEVPRGDPLELTERALVSSAEMLGFDLEPARRREIAGFGTDAPAAYDLYMRGLGQLGAATPESVDAAIGTLEQATTLDPGFAAAHAALGQAWIQQQREFLDADRLERAGEACQRAVELDARLADGHHCLGVVHQAGGQLEEAAAAYDRAAYLEPTLDAAVLAKAELYSRLGRVSEAEETYRTAIELRPHYWPNYVELGVFYYVEGRLEEATAMFEEAVARAPSYRIGLSSLGGLYTLLGRYEDGVGVLERALQLQPSGPAYSNLATTYFALRRFTDAIAAYQEAIRFEPDSWMSWGNLGDVYYWAPGERANAPAAYRRALELVGAHLEEEPDDANAISDLAKFTGMLGETEAAVRNLNRALAMTPRDPQILYHGVLIHLRDGDEDAALEYLERAVAAGYSLPWIRDSAELDVLRDSPRFQSLVEQH